MPEENAEVVRAAFQAWNELRMDDLRELYDPDTTILSFLDGWPEQGPAVGREAVMRQWQRQRETWDTDTLEPVSEFIEAGDRVAVRVLWRASGRGPEMNMEFTGIYTVRNGKILFLEHFWDHSKALAALGKQPGQDHQAPG